MSYRRVAVFAVLVLVVAGLFVTARESEALVSPVLPPDAPLYAHRGPHGVGTRDLRGDGTTALAMTVWYPAVEVDNQEAVTRYPYAIKLPAPLRTLTIASYAGQAHRDAPYDLSSAPYPLVILSPGFALGSSTYAWLAEHLASYGFVVLSAEHREQFDVSMSGFWQATIARPQDILSVLAYADAQAGIGGTLEGLINPELVAVVGHSYGGYTTLAASGARLDTAAFEARCEAARNENDPNVWLCDMLVPHLGGMADLAGLDGIPDGLWPVWADSRIDAIVPLAGDAYLFDEAGLAPITVPVLAIGGTHDHDTPYAWGTHPTYEFVSSPTKVRIALHEAEHMIFTGRCDAIPWFLRVAKVVTGEFCSDAVWDRAQAHALVNHFTSAFLLAELKQDAKAAAALKPEAVAFPDLTYDAQGY